MNKKSPTFMGNCLRALAVCGSLFWGLETLGQSASFNFDPGTPVLQPRAAISATLPTVQSAPGLSLGLVAVSGSLSFQTAATFGSAGLPVPVNLPGISGNFIYGGGTTNVLELRFDRPVTRVSLSFATPDIQGTRDIPTTVALAANASPGVTLVNGLVSTNGTYVDDVFAAGELTLDSATPFCSAQVLIPSGQAMSTPFFLVDSITAVPSSDARRLVSAIAYPSYAGTVSGAAFSQPGTAVNLTASPRPGYGFVNWTENGVILGTNSVLALQSSSNRWINANFDLLSKITITASPFDGGTFKGDGNYINGSVASVTAIPAPGYSFSAWTEKGKTISTSTNLTWTVSGSRTLVAVFQLGSPVTASADPSFAGTVQGAGIYSNGKPVNLIANPIFGYTFSSWTENNAVVSTNAILSFVASGPRALVAHFVASPRYSITALANPGAGGSVSGGGSYSPQDAVTLTAIPAAGYVFRNWTAVSGFVNEVVSANPVFTFNPSASRTYTANFVPGSDTTIVIGLGQNAPGGTLAGGGSYKSGDRVTVTAVESNGWKFSGWSGGSQTVSTNAAFQFLAKTNQTLVAVFQPVLQILPQPAGGMLLFWPTPAGLSGFVLEASDPLAPAVWAPVTNPTAANQSWTETLIGADGAQRFFRLRQP